MKNESLRRSVTLLRHFLFPPRCIACESCLPITVEAGTILCLRCRAAWEAAVLYAAPAAEAELSRGQVFLTFYRRDMQEGVPERVIYHIKQRGDRRVFAFVAARLAPRIARAVERIPTRQPLTPVEYPLLFTYPPRRPAAICLHGFDQAARLSRALAKACGGESASLIRRSLRGGEQKHLDARDRTQNAVRAYVLKPRAPARVLDRTVVICDDLCTTGATLRACANLMVEAGARSVLYATVAGTPPRP